MLLKRLSKLSQQEIWRGCRRVATGQDRRSRRLGRLPSMRVVRIKELAREETCDEGRAEARQEHHRESQDVRGIHRRGTRRDEGSRPGDEGGCAPRAARRQGGWGKRAACEDR